MLIERDPSIKRSQKTLRLLDQANAFKGSAHFPIEPQKEQTKKEKELEDVLELIKAFEKNEIQDQQSLQNTSIFDEPQPDTQLQESQWGFK